MGTFNNKLIDATHNHNEINIDKKKHIKLEIIDPFSVSELTYLLDELKKMNDKFRFMISVNIELRGCST